MLHIGVCRVDQLRKSSSLEETSRSNLHVAHNLAGAFQQTRRIGYVSATKESDIHVSFEGIDVCKCCVSDACRRMTIMQHLPHIVPTLAHDLEPIFRYFPQFAAMLPRPRIDGWIFLNRTGESK